MAGFRRCPQSGGCFKRHKDASSDTMQLVGSGTVGSNSNEFVNTPTIEIAGTQGISMARLAWWTSDEGVKTSVGLTDRTEVLEEAFFADYSAAGLSNDEQRQILKQIGPRRHRAEILFGNDTELVPGDTENITDTSVADRLGRANSKLTRVLSWSSLALTQGIEEAELNANFHDATNIAKAVLTDTRNGGLKKDLSDRDYEDATFTPAINQSLMDFLWARGPDADGHLSLSDLSSSDIDTLEVGDAVPTISPILTEVALYFAVSGQRVNSSTARAFLRLEVELWSPHGFRHSYSGPSGSDTPELMVEFENLPDITLSF